MGRRKNEGFRLPWTSAARRVASLEATASRPTSATSASRSGSESEREAGVCEEGRLAIMGVGKKEADGASSLGIRLSGGGESHARNEKHKEMEQ